ncbi:hypothetical protein B4125_1839 [Bacillus paralicheniformis]|nr:hypothetical protein SC10_B2orf03440 [Bacillus paralicheniformis]OLG07658.1 hypothetical protein B4125_1839 [Bacillus paralicheniformis]
MIIQYNGFTPLRIVLKYQLFLLCLLRWYSFAFSGNQSSALYQGKENRRTKIIKQNRACSRNDADPFNGRHQTG